MHSRHRGIAAGVVLLCGCASASHREVAALIVNPTPASRAELRLAVQRALHSGPVLLADDALTHTEMLSIDRGMRRDAQGRPLSGLDAHGRPELFRLVKNHDGCVLIHLDAAQLRQTLQSATCRPAPHQK